MSSFFDAPAAGRQPSVEELVDAVILALGRDAGRVAQIHQASDVDGSPVAQHHTLGSGPGQAAAGDHEHGAATGGLRNWRTSYTGAAVSTPTAAEVKLGVVPELELTVLAGRDYTIRATAGVSGSVGPYAGELRVRATSAAAGTTAPLASPVVASPILAGATFAGDLAGGPGQQTVTLIRTLRVGVAGELSYARYRLGVFLGRTSGGNVSGLVLNNGAMELEVTEKVSG